MLEGGARPDASNVRRLPFSFTASGGIGQLALSEMRVGPVEVMRLELEVSDLGTDPGQIPAERFQRRRTRLRGLSVRISAAAIEQRVEDVRRQLASLGITNLHARLADGYVSVRARAADGLAAADVSFRVSLVSAGVHLRALASHVRVHGHLPTPGPIVADRVLAQLLGATDTAGVFERPTARGLCDVEIDLIRALLWSLMPPAGWRLPSVSELDLLNVRMSRASIDVAFGPSGSRVSDPGGRGDVHLRPASVALGAAHDLMHSADQQLRGGHVEEAMRGYRALLAAGGPEQPQLLERILALASARPPWFFDGLELARQAIGRWPRFPAAHAALASITLAQGDAREAASHLTHLAHQASADGDDDQAALAALAGARLLRVLEPKAATQLYELALEHDPSSAEAADALADRLADEQRWPELVRLLRARAVTFDTERAVALRLRLADVFVHQLADPASAQHELAIARELAPENPAVHEMTATILSSSNPSAALDAWHEVARLAEQRGDARSAARAYAIVGDLIAKRYAAEETSSWERAEAAWRRALELDPLQTEAIAGLATAAAARGDHDAAAELYERLRGVGLPQHTAGRYELMMARSLVQLERLDEARAALRRATLSGGETAAEAHAVLAEIAEATNDNEHAAAELDTAIRSFVDLAHQSTSDERLLTRAAQLAMSRALLLDDAGQPGEASRDYERAHDFAQSHAPDLARDAARTLLARSSDPANERRWIDAVLATYPPALERASLLVQRADVRRREVTPDLPAALTDLHGALELVEIDAQQAAQDPDYDADVLEHTAIRRRAYQLEADILGKGGDQRARAQALTALARMADGASERVEVETAAAAAWLAADEPATALPHGARAHAELESDVPSPLRREVLTTLGEAAWRQRAWPDVIRAYRGLVDDPDVDPAREGTFRFRLAMAADRTGDPDLALRALTPLVEGHAVDASTSSANTARSTAPEIRGQALRLYADLAERAGHLPQAATALEGFAGVTSDGTPTSRADAMYRAGELFRRADRADDAIRCLEAALRISDTHMPALDALELAWRERGDIERVSVILGRKVAATGRHPQRQKSLLSRLGDLQDQLGRPDVALATHQRALEIDPTWRPSLRYVTTRLHADGALIAAAGGFAQLAGELASDGGLDNAIVARERQLAGQTLSDLVATLDDAQLEAVRSIVVAPIERASADPSTNAAAGLARLRGEPPPRSANASDASDENTPSGRHKDAIAGALSLRDAARRARAAGRPREAFASLEAANHVAPDDAAVLAELVELATEIEDHAAAAAHLRALASMQTGARRGESLLGLADIYYDRLDDVQAARSAMRDAAEGFGFGSRRDSTLRLLASEAASHLAWDVAIEAISSIDAPRRVMADHVLHATALVRAGKADEAVTAIEEATAARKFDDGGLLLQSLRAEVARRAHFTGKALVAQSSQGVHDAQAEPTEPIELWHSIGSVVGAPSLARRGEESPATRDALLVAQREAPDDPDALVKVLAFLEITDPQMRRTVLEKVASDGRSRAQAIACHELALLARSEAHDPLRAAALWQKAHRIDPTYTPVWMPLADALVAADEIDLARELYEQVAASSAFDGERRTWAAQRVEALAYDDAVVSGEIGASRPTQAVPRPSLAQARLLAEGEKLAEAIALAEQIANADLTDVDALDLLEQLYLEVHDVTAASEAIGRQLVLAHEPDERARLWRRRAKIYRDALGRDAEAYRCLKEAHACAPTDPEIAYQLRTAAMVRGEWALVASLLYREIAGAPSPRDRGALHLELALIFQEKLEDPAQAQVNFEQALAFDPTIPAAKAPLARRYEEIGNHHDAARLYLEAAANARAAERPALLNHAARNRAASNALSSGAGLAAQLERAVEQGDGDAALDLARKLWRSEPGHAAAYRVLANHHRMSGDLDALTELTIVRVERSTSGAEKAEAWIELAHLADELERHTEAARAYDLALVEDQANEIALDARGALAMKLDDWNTADLIYRQLASGVSLLAADDLAIRRAHIAEHLGRIDEALELAKQAASLAPGRYDIMLLVQHLAIALGDPRAALSAARTALELVPLDDEDALVHTRQSLVDLHRVLGEYDDAIGHLEHIVRDRPHFAPAIEQLAELNIAKGDWHTATRFLYQLVPLANSTHDKAERLYRLGEAILVHLGEVDRADDVFLRVSDLEPMHVPTLRRLLDVYWRGDDPGALVEVANDLASKGALTSGPVAASSLAQAVVAGALVGDTQLAGQIISALGDDAPTRIAAALAELAGRTGKLQVASASTAIAELGRRGMLDIAKVRAAATGTPVANALS